MSKQEVSGETTTSSAADPNYRIPKLSGRKSLQSTKLNDLAINISPPARERKKETDENKAYQPHK